MTADDVDKVLLILESAYPNWKPKRQTILLWRAVLVPLDAGIVERAVMEFVISPREFAPSVGEVIERSSRIKAELAGQPAMSAEEGWSEVHAAIHTVGYYRSPQFKNPAISRAVAALGWKDICINPNVEATRAHFFRIFNAFQEEQLREHRLAFIGELKALVDSTTKALEYIN